VNATCEYAISLRQIDSDRLNNAFVLSLSMYFLTFVRISKYVIYVFIISHRNLYIFFVFELPIVMTKRIAISMWFLFFSDFKLSCYRRVFIFYFSIYYRALILLPSLFLTSCDPFFLYINIECDGFRIIIIRRKTFIFLMIYHDRGGRLENNNNTISDKYLTSGIIRCEML
jgi:hypothetical protein